MASPQFEIGLLRVAILCLLLQAGGAQRITSNKEELIQDTVRKFLGVKSDERTAVPGKTQPVPPRYMMDLYEKYRSGQTPMQGNTVRSILAMRVKVDKVDMLVFNLTGLKSTEQILQSKLYLLKRRKPKGGKKRDQATFRLNIGCLPDMPAKHQIDISLARHKPEWHSYDISESVVSCRQIRKGNDSLLGLTLDVKRSKGSYRAVAFKRLVKPDSQPFVLIFSEDSQNQSTSSLARETAQDGYEEIGDLLRARANAEGLLPENFRPRQTSGTAHRHKVKRSIDSDYSDGRETKPMPEFQPDSFLSSDEYSRKYLTSVMESFNVPNNSHCDLMKLLPSIIHNVRYSLTVNRKIEEDDYRSPGEMHPDAEPDFRHLNLTNEATEKVLFPKRLVDKNTSQPNETEGLSSRKSKRSISDALRYSTEVKESNISQPTVEVFDDTYIKRQSAEVKPRRRKGRRKLHETPRKHKKKRRRNRKLPFWWTRHDSQLHAQDMKLLCKRKSLVVDFSQLGWDDWIISPKSFNAHFCEGSCTFPIIKHTETSNHAAVQSLIHAMGLNTNIPTPSCVPSTTSSLTLLYFDENGGLVLKSYPNMIVEKCGCR